MKDTYWCSECRQVFPLEELTPDPTPLWLDGTLTIYTKEGIVRVKDQHLLCKFDWVKRSEILEGTEWM